MHPCVIVRRSLLRSKFTESRCHGYPLHADIRSHPLAAVVVGHGPKGMVDHYISQSRAVS